MQIFALISGVGHELMSSFRCGLVALINTPTKNKRVKTKQMVSEDPFQNSYPKFGTSPLYSSVLYTHFCLYMCIYNAMSRSQIYTMRIYSLYSEQHSTNANDDRTDANPMRLFSPAGAKSPTGTVRICPPPTSSFASTTRPGRCCCAPCTRCSTVRRPISSGT